MKEQEKMINDFAETKANEIEKYLELVLKACGYNYLSLNSIYIDEFTETIKVVLKNAAMKFYTKGMSDTLNEVTNALHKGDKKNKTPKIDFWKN